MSKPRYDWWGYVKKIMYRYPNTQRPSEASAIKKAIKETKERCEDGDERLALIHAMYWGKIHYNIPGAALLLPGVSEATAKRWHRDFLKAVACNMGLLPAQKK